jgi:hypothetical protein
MTALIDAMRTAGRGFVLHEGQVHSYVVEQPGWLVDYEMVLRLDDGREVIVSDSYDDLGFVYRAPDSGREMTNIVVPLAEGETPPPGLPDASSARNGAFTALAPIFASVSACRTDADDLDFARQLFSSPEAMMRSIERHGSVDAARIGIMRDVLRIDPSFLP